ncbi:lysozyme inhibitor LprI family protein [Uruburuella testudinis]|uniref:Lysozyme inhibitor LprI family protein n=2 Tax=Uruburuella testudinis TaxID=1282863 RepID=A0ABY4DX89_9NEIS|nr:lysozyme inhibitor LprI family protein [Uruburuella testudinis]UOO83279.1 lysozyme inhibitor LprI family protein [Uruburuella testudinis]
MYKKLLTFSLIAAALSACGDDKPQPPALVCNDPAVLQSVRGNVQEIIKQEARAFAQNDARQFVDADKIIAAGSELLITLDNPAQETRNGTNVCSANLRIQIPAAILSTAQTNSPLIYGDQTINQIIQQRTTGSTLTYDGAGVFSRTLGYTPTTSDGQTVINYADNSLTGTAQAVSAALLPYGVKSILIVNGQALSLEDALRLRHQPFAEPPVATPADILDNNAASAVFGQAAPAEASPPEVLSPVAPNNDEVLFSANELEQAKNNNRAADEEINRLWERMDKTVQQRLLNEQRSWIQSKNNSCRQAAAQANSTLQAEYLQLQCDTRMTRERSQYLRGYTIN